MTSARPNVLFYAVSHGVHTFVPTLLALAKRFTELHKERIGRAWFLVGDKGGYEAVKGESSEALPILFQHERFDPFGNERQLTEAEIADLERAYGVPNLKPMIVSERVLEGLSFERKLRYTCNYLSYYRGLCKELQPSILVSQETDCIPIWTAHQVLSREGVTCLHIYNCRMPGRIILVDNPIEQLRGIEERFRDALERGLSAEELQRVRDARALYDRRTKPAGYVRVKSRVLPEPMKWLKAQWMVHQHLDGRLWYPSFSSRLRGTAARPLREVANRWGIQWERTPKEPYFYYPLHLEPEISLSILGFFNRDQGHLIEQIADSLPVGYTLYVKEHPTMEKGRRPIGFYRRLAGIPGVKVLTAQADGFDVISRAEAVVTIAGTTGLEALFSRKPVVLLGRAVYERFPGVFRVNALDQLPGILGELARRRFVFDDRTFDCYVHAFLSSTHQGRWIFDDPLVSSPENVDQLARAVSIELTRRGALPSAAVVPA